MNSISCERLETEIERLLSTHLATLAGLARPSVENSCWFVGWCEEIIEAKRCVDESNRMSTNESVPCHSLEMNWSKCIRAHRIRPRIEVSSGLRERLMSQTSRIGTMISMTNRWETKK